MKKILHVGNNLKNNRSNPTYISLLGPKLEKEGYSISYTSSKQNKLLRLSDMLFAVFKYHKKRDLVLIDTYSTTNFYYAFLVSQLCRLLRFPYITILHGGNLPERLARSPWKSNCIFKNSKLNISPSLYLKNEFENRDYQNIKYIPNSIEIEKYNFKPKTYKSIRILWVRSLASIYNPKLAIEILKIIVDKGHDATLTMVGPDTENLKDQLTEIAEGYKVKVKFTGKLNKKEWHELAQDHNVFLNTSNFDNMPVTLIEAMALGLPVVTSNVGGIPYLINDRINGILYPSNNASASANAILELYNSTDIYQLIVENARSKAESFDWSNVKSLWISVLK